MINKLKFAALLMLSGAALAQAQSAGRAPAPAMPVPASTMAPGGAGPARSEPADTSATAATSTTISASDKQFIKKAASGGMAEVQAAQLAQHKADDRQVEDFAKQMITDHTAANQELTTLAEKKGVTVPAGLDSKDQNELDKLDKLGGKKFDKAYMKTQVKDHQAMLSLLQKEAKSGKDSDLKSFAEQTVPIVQHHFEMAQSDNKCKKRPEVAGITISSREPTALW
jgi:putative membrane protein